MKFRKALVAVLVASLLTLATGSALASVPSSVYGEVIEQLHITDLAPTHWAAGPITELYQAGILAGDPAGTFRPEANTSMSEGVAVIARVLGLATKNDSLATTMQKAQLAGLVSTSEAATPNADMTRLDMARIIARALGISPKSGVTAANFPFNDANRIPQSDWGLIAALHDAGIFAGYPNGSFGASGTLNRAELATLVFRLLGRASR